MSNDCLCEIIHKRSLYSAWQLCEIIHNLGYRGICLPVPEVDMAVSLSLSIAYLVGQYVGQEQGSEPLKLIQKWLLIFLYAIDIKALSSRPRVEPNGLL